MKWIGSKTEALFDWWSFGHIGFFYLVTEVFLLDYSFLEAVTILIILGYLWEIIERALEDYDGRHKKVFFIEKEGWWNRYVGDIIADIIGFLLAWFF